MKRAWYQGAENIKVQYLQIPSQKKYKILVWCTTKTCAPVVTRDVPIPNLTKKKILSYARSEILPGRSVITHNKVQLSASFHE